MELIDAILYGFDLASQADSMVEYSSAAHSNLSKWLTDYFK